MALTRITSGIVADNSLGLANIADNAIDATKIAQNSILTRHIDDNQITNAQMADDAIDSAEIADGAIDLVHMSVNSIDSDQYVDLSIDTAHLAADVITGAKIADDAIDSEHYTDVSIDTAHIADDQITLAKMAGITRGSIIIGNSSGNPAALAIGTNDYVLTSDGTDIAWEAASSFDADAAQTFNDSGADVDFRIESNNNANMFFVDGGTDAVGIGTNSPVADGALHVVGANGILVDTDGNGDGSIYFGHNAGTDRSYIVRSSDDLIINNLSAGNLKIANNNTDRLTIDSAGNISVGGATPKTFHSSYNTIQGYNYTLSEDSASGASKATTWCYNAYIDSGNAWTYMNGDEATQIQQYNGQISFATAAAGSAEGDITFVSHLHMENSGKVHATRNGNITHGSGYNAFTAFGGADNWDHFAVEMYQMGNGGILSLTSNGNSAKSYTGRATDNSVTFYVEGDGDYYFSGSSQSDRDSKENIADVPNGSLALVKQLRPRTFNFKASHDGAPLSTNPKTGFIAQEVESVFGTDDGVATGTDGSGRMGVDPTGIVAHLTKAVQELEARLEALE